MAKKTWKKYRSKYRLTILRNSTLDEVFQICLSKINVISIITSLSILFFIIVFLLIAFTPLKEFIPDYPDRETRINIIKNAHKLDSLEQIADLNQKYMDNMKALLKGTPTNDYIITKDLTPVSNDSVSLNILPNDSIFRVRLENENEYDMLSATANLENALVFFPPIKGIVTNTFNPKKNHFGIDIAGKSNQDIFTCYEGTVILSTWSLETGFVITIQHSDNIISIYKHLKSVSIKQGDEVHTGKQIGKVGDVGTLSTGPHLHFELWRNGKAISPNNYIKF